jgi:hypothetical protein
MLMLEQMLVQQSLNEWIILTYLFFVILPIRSSVGKIGANNNELQFQRC